MTGQFDPSALRNLASSLDDDSRIVEVDADELRRIGSIEARRICGSLKLASRIIGVATASQGDVSDSHLLESMRVVLERLEELRRVGMQVVGVDSKDGDYAAVFNSVTSTMLDVVTEEWKWSRLDGESFKPLSHTVIKKLLESAVLASPERFEPHLAGTDLSNVRRLCVLEAMPKLFSLTNMFDYFQASPHKLTERLIRSVVQLAEFHAALMTDEPLGSLVGRSVLQRMYGVSTGLMCEVYKAQAAIDVAALRAMAPADRAFAIADAERLGGLPFDHILDKHRETMDRMMDTANLILESGQQPRRG